MLRLDPLIQRAGSIRLRRNSPVPVYLLDAELASWFCGIPAARCARSLASGVSRVEQVVLSELVFGL
ncbi:MAG: hypothetical protein ACE1ZA_12295, partial [Pseudomonadales bacterium]